jgi:hypothetical protein
MNKIVTVAFASAVAAGFAPAFAQTAPVPGPSLAAADTGSEAGIAPVAGSPDADVGLEGYTAGSCVSVYSADVSSVGPVFGDDGKDTLARTVVGTDCR